LPVPEVKTSIYNESKIKLEVVKDNKPTGMGIGCPRERRWGSYAQIRSGTEIDEVKIHKPNGLKKEDINPGHIVSLEATCSESTKNPYPKNCFMYCAEAGGAYYTNHYKDYQKAQWTIKREGDSTGPIRDGDIVTFWNV
jgi:hypothetical protein